MNCSVGMACPGAGDSIAAQPVFPAGDQDSDVALTLDPGMQSVAWRNSPTSLPALPDAAR